MKKQIICSRIDIVHRRNIVDGATILAENINYQSDTSNEDAGTVLQEEVTVNLLPEKIPDILQTNLRFFLLTLYTADNQQFNVGTETYPAVREFGKSKSGGQIKFIARKPL